MIRRGPQVQKTRKVAREAHIMNPPEIENEDKAPAGSGIIPQREGENPLRQQFVRIRNVAKCPKCAVKGALKLTGGSVSAPLSLKCGKCFMVK